MDAAMLKGILKNPYFNTIEFIWMRMFSRFWVVENPYAWMRV
jgi:hypothetical protein